MSFKWLNIPLVPAPPESSLAPIYPTSNLCDSYLLEVPKTPLSVKQIAALTFSTQPKWFTFLLATRDILVSPFGVKSTTQIRDATSSQKRIEFFPILRETEDEVILGEKDRHLDFQISVFMQDDVLRERTRIYMTTVVGCNNFFGRLYLFTITPFHKLVVKSALARLEEKLNVG